MDFENIINQVIWNLIEKKYKNCIIYCGHDHTYNWLPNKYYLPIYLNANQSSINLEIIKLDFFKIIMSYTGLRKDQITIVLYQKHEIYKL
jgi:hypothetical protein